MFANKIPLQELKRHGVETVIRVCDPTYQTKPLLEAGIVVLVRKNCVSLYNKSDKNKDLSIRSDVELCVLCSLYVM